MKNYAGVEDCDDGIKAELEEAGVHFNSHEFLRSQNEVPTSIIGEFKGWSFKRAWIYWIVEGPGLQFDYATRLHEEHGQSVRVAGHCGCPSPGEWYHGFATPLYHVDTQEGLNALVKTLKEVAIGADITFNILDFIYDRSTALAGRINGQNCYNNIINFGIKFEDYKTITIIIPSQICTMNKSFFSEVWANQVKSLGTEGFEEKFIFDTSMHIKKKIKKHISSVLLDITLEELKDFVDN